MEFNTKTATIISFNKDGSERLKIKLGYKKSFEIEEHTEEGRKDVVRRAIDVVKNNPIKLPCTVMFGNKTDNTTVLVKEKTWA